MVRDTFESSYKCFLGDKATTDNRVCVHTSIALLTDMLVLDGLVDLISQEHV